ncbi:hypothetical protein NPX13_g9700 [Xylaria arbuscula]|uniref:Heterokaryon incompatibility domain-containing protein n=1 Tax=Xylaria arbuscula TaxID=114810 RepID=A0A9W8N5X1_9PEZI|nr:hypothetical protein NPX13_g9700 [Xylaria arbuscula]
MEQNRAHQPRIQVTLPNTSCRICGWDGEPATWWRSLRDQDLNLEDIRNSTICVSCQILTAVYEGCVIGATGGLPKSTSGEIRRSTVAYGAFAVHREGTGRCDFSVSARETWRIFSTPNKNCNLPLDLVEQSIPFPDPSRQSAIEWAKKETIRCIQSHEECQRWEVEEPRSLPTRLIDIKPDGLEDDVVLMDSASLPYATPYIALSYCWGDIRPECTTTPDSLSANKRSIPWLKLPKTFQDAIIVARQMSIRYMWIDSICIIQGDDDDWKREGGKMFQVYKNSYLTFAATWGKSSTSGLFDGNERFHGFENSWERLCVAELQYNGERWPLYLQRFHNDILFDHEHHPIGYGLPLFERAWTFQERLISLRVLFFGPAEVSFECLSHDCCHCGGTASRGRKGRTLRITKLQEDSLRGPSDVARRDIQARFAWRKLVREYSTRDLSFARDKLLAIGALAELWQRVLPGDQYLAGLWSGWLIEDLLWSDQGGGYLQLSFNTWCPTWSWAHLQKHHVLAWPDTFNRGRFYPMADVVQANCEYVGGNPFGVLEKSELVLRGYLLPFLACRYSNEKVKPDLLISRYAALYLNAGDQYSFLRLRFLGGGRDTFVMETDCVLERGITQLYLLYMGWMAYFDSSSRNWYYLVLKPTDHTKTTFSRVGVVFTSAGSIWRKLLDKDTETTCVII